MASTWPQRIIRTTPNPGANGTRVPAPASARAYRTGAAGDWVIREGHDYGQYVQPQRSPGGSGNMGGSGFRVVGEARRQRDCPLENFNRIGSNIDLDLIKPLKQGCFELEKELPVFRRIVNVHG